MKKFILIFFALLVSIGIKAQKTPDFYLNKRSKDIMKEFQDTTVFNIVKDSIKHNNIVVYNKTTNDILAFYFSPKDSVQNIYFSTDNHETADIYFDIYDKKYLDMGYTKKVMKEDDYGSCVRWSMKQKTITFRVKTENRNPFIFTYSISNEKIKK